MLSTIKGHITNVFQGHALGGKPAGYEIFLQREDNGEKLLMRVSDNEISWGRRLVIEAAADDAGKGEKPLIEIETGEKDVVKFAKIEGTLILAR